MKSLLVAIAAIAITSTGVCLPSGQSAGSGSNEQSKSDLKPLPKITLQDFNGRPIKAASFKGNVVVLDFWATWCGPCIAEIPALNRLQEKYGSRGLKVVGVTLASGEAKEIKPFVGKNGMKYTVLIGDDDQAYDFNIVGFPTTYLLTKDLKIFRKYIGSGPGKSSQLEADIQRLLTDGAKID
jgi:thiol-disulfide isomerase/thioredoxin